MERSPSVGQQPLSCYKPPDSVRYRHGETILAILSKVIGTVIAESYTEVSTGSEQSSHIKCYFCKVIFLYIHICIHLDIIQYMKDRQSTQYAATVSQLSHGVLHTVIHRYRSIRAVFQA